MWVLLDGAHIQTITIDTSVVVVEPSVRFVYTAAIWMQLRSVSGKYSPPSQSMRQPISKQSSFGCRLGEVTFVDNTSMHPILRSSKHYGTILIDYIPSAVFPLDGRQTTWQPCLVLPAWTGWPSGRMAERIHSRSFSGPLPSASRQGPSFPRCGVLARFSVGLSCRRRFTPQPPNPSAAE